MYSACITAYDTASQVVQIKGTRGMGTELEITYDQSMLMPFKTMGILTFPSSGSTASEALVLSDTKIRSQLIGKVN